MRPTSPAQTKIVFFGNERLATGVSTDAPTLRSLVTAGYDVTAVVSHNTEGASRKPRQLEIADVAAEYGIPLLLPNKPAEIIDQLRAYRPDLGVLVAYGKIVPQSVIDIFPQGIINIHPSLLPLHRGSIPIEAVILDGAIETGVSVMRLVQAMDAGPVYGQARLTLTGDASKQQLADRLLQRGGKLLLELLPGIVDGSLQPADQNDAQASYDERITKPDGWLDFHKPADRLAREVRAYQDWPKSRAVVDGVEVIITAAHAIPADISPAGRNDEIGKLTIVNNTVLTIRTSAGDLAIDRLKPAGKADMTAAAWLAGHKQRV